MRQPFNILIDGDNLLQVLVLTVAKDGIVDYYAVDRVVVIRID
jgi:hypothetical protein